MGWSIQTNNKDKWSLISSVTDSEIATYENQEELVNFIAMEQVYKGKLKAIETLLTFPDGWMINEKLTPHNNSEKYFSWHKSVSLISETYEEYYKAIDNKLDELLKI